MSGSSSDISSIPSTTSSISVLCQRLHCLNVNFTHYIPTAAKPVLRGSKADRFKPIAVTGIYAKLIKNYDEVDYIAENLVRSISNDFNNVHMLLQIIPDLMLINYKIEKYTSQDYDAIYGATLNLEASKLKHVKLCDIVFTHNSQYARSLSSLIDVFLWHLCSKLTANQTVLPIFEKTMRVFLSFLKHVATSEFTALRLTAFIFLLRIHKNLCLRQMQFAHALFQMDRMDPASGTIPEFIDHIISAYKISELYGGIQNNALYHLFYLEFAKCAHILIVSSNLYLTQRNIQLLADLIQFKDKEIAKAAIETCTFLMQQDCFTELYAMPAFDDISRNICKRLNHNDEDFVVLATIFFATGIQFKHDFHDLFDDIYDKLVIGVYSTNLKLAQSCAQAVALYIRTMNVSSFLKSLVNMGNHFNDKTNEKASHVKYAYLVEAMWKYLPLEPIDVLTELLKRARNYTRDEYSDMMELFFYLCCLYYRGKIPIERNRGKIVQEIEGTSKYRTSSSILNTFSLLMSNANNDSETAVWIFKSLALIDYSMPNFYQLKTTVTAIVNESLKLFDDMTRNSELWLSIVYFIQEASKMIEGDAYIIRLEQKLGTLLQQYTQCFDLLTNATVGTDNWLEIQQSIMLMSSKIRVIFHARIDVSHIDVGLFLNNWHTSDFPDDIIKEQIQITALYFKCEIRRYCANLNQSGMDFDHFVRGVKTFWNEMDLLLQSKDIYFYTILESMGILIANYKQLGCEKLSVANFCHWRDWNQAKNIFSTFFRDCIESAAYSHLPIKLRRHYLDIIFTLYYGPINANPFTAIILKLVLFYEKCHHLYKSSYKKFFNGIIEEDIDDFFYIILTTLFTFPDNPCAKDIKLEKWCLLIKQHLSDDETVKFLKFFINFIAENNAIWIRQFFPLFSEGLSQGDKNEINLHAETTLTEAQMVNV